MPFKIFRFLLLLPILFLAHVSMAQQYGFEWIKTYQPYYKFLVGKTATTTFTITLQDETKPVLTITQPVVNENLTVDATDCKFTIKVLHLFELIASFL